MTIDNILKVVYSVIAFFAAAIPLLIALVVNIKQKIKICKQLEHTTDDAEKAKLEASSSAATTEMMNICGSLIANAENLYADVTTQLKTQGKSAGIVKKDSVMSKLQAYALSQGYVFDNDFWSIKIDELVALTKSVNVTK